MNSFLDLKKINLFCMLNFFFSFFFYFFFLLALFLPLCTLFIWFATGKSHSILYTSLLEGAWPPMGIFLSFCSFPINMFCFIIVHYMAVAEMLHIMVMIYKYFQNRMCIHKKHLVGFLNYIEVIRKKIRAGAVVSKMLFLWNILQIH